MSAKRLRMVGLFLVLFGVALAVYDWPEYYRHCVVGMRIDDVDSNGSAIRYYKKFGCSTYDRLGFALELVMIVGGLFVYLEKGDWTT